MKIDILYCCIGREHDSEVIDFFDKLARALNEDMYIDVEYAFSRQGMPDLYSIRIGGGYGPILKGGADAVISLDLQEAVELCFYPNDDGGMVILNDERNDKAVSGRSRDCLQRCINSCFKVFDFSSNILEACLLALRIVGFTKERVLTLLENDLCEITDIIDSVYAKKYIKA